MLVTLGGIFIRLAVYRENYKELFGANDSQDSCVFKFCIFQPFQSSEVLKALKHYVKALQKDRLHTVNRYKHMQETDPAEAEATREHMAEHVRNVDQQLEDALTMLDRLPKFKNKIRTQIGKLLSSAVLHCLENYNLLHCLVY